MSLQARKAKELELDAAALRWKSIPPEGNQGTVEASKNEVLLMAFKLYDREDQGNEWDYDPNIFLNALTEALDKYTPEAGKFSHYLSLLLSGRKKDAYYHDMRHAPKADSLDRPLTEDQNETLGDVLPAPERFEPESTVYIDSLLAELTSAIMTFLNLRDREHNDRRKMWFRLFYTEDMTLAMKTLELRFVHERDIFSTMDTEYLDYYMAAPCRTGQAVMVTPLKPYSQVADSQEDTGPVPLPIPAGVSLRFLKVCRNETAGNSARSNQMKPYTELKAYLRPKTL